MNKYIYSQEAGRSPYSGDLFGATTLSSKGQCEQSNAISSNQDPNKQTNKKNIYTGTATQVFIFLQASFPCIKQSWVRTWTDMARAEAL